MKDNNRVYIIKSKVGKAELMNDLYDKYIKDTELPIMIAYDSNITVSSIPTMFIINPADVNLKQLMNEFIAKTEKDIKMYCGRIFIYTNETERKCKDLITECKTHDFGEFIDKFGDKRTDRTFYIFCS